MASTKTIDVTIPCDGIVGSEECGYAACKSTDYHTVDFGNQYTVCCKKCGRFHVSERPLTHKPDTKSMS